VTHDGRFAPSPTGPLHLGSLRTALVAWLMARSHGARFLLRIEDLDPQRSRPEFEQSQLADLSALGLDWDEPPVRQSQRTRLYDDALGKLHAARRLYPCFCTRAEIREAASAPHDGLPEGAYPGKCREIPPAERRRRIESGERFALRLRADAERIEFTDQLLGAQSEVVDDFVVVRADGVHAYQLAVVVDDAAQYIGEVVRGADLAESTPRQILLQRLLSLPTPSYAHVPLVLSARGVRLAKRDRGSTLADRDEPAPATLALLAHSLGLASGRDRVQSPAELIAEFDPDLVPRDPVSLT
jgi:glutamyl-tRNA synthetase